MWINIDGCDYEIFQTKRDWETDSRSSAWRSANCKRGCRAYHLAASEEPIKFPALALFGGFNENPNGHDEITTTWFYDFKENGNGNCDSTD